MVVFVVGAKLLTDTGNGHDCMKTSWLGGGVVASGMQRELFQRFWTSPAKTIPSRKNVDCG